MDPELLAQFPIAEAAIEALGLVLWPMVEFEADDAIAAAAERFAADPRVERVVICTPDKDMAQCVRDERVVLWDRRRDLVYDDAGRPREVGRARRRASPTAWRSSATRRTASRACPAGATSPRRPCSRGTGPSRRSRRNGGDWDVPGLRNPVGLAATLRERMDEALLYRDLARLRTTADGVPIPQADVDELRWRGADRAALGGVLRRVGPRPACASRPHRWLARTRSEPQPDGPGPRPLERRVAPRATAAAAPRGAPAAPRRSRTSRVALSTSNHGPPVQSVTTAPAALGDQPGRRDVPGGHPAGLQERVEAAVARRRRAPAPPSPCCATPGPPCGPRGPGSRPPGRRAPARHAVVELRPCPRRGSRGRRASPARRRRPRTSRRASGRGPRRRPAGRRRRAPTETQKYGIPFA